MWRSSRESQIEMFYKSKLQKSIPPLSKSSEIVREKSVKELIPDNFSVFPEIVKSLRSKNFLLYFSGQLVSLTGFWIQQIAMSWLVLSLSDGNLKAFSLVVFLSNFPTLILTPFSGVVSDMFDRRKILICTQSLAMFLSLSLSLLTLFGLINIELIMLISLCFGIVVSFDAPARQSFYSKLVPMSDLGNAIALNSIAINGTRLIGPALGGVLINLVGEGHCFLINALSFLAVLSSLFIIKVKPSPKPQVVLGALAQIKEGFIYLKGSVPLRSIILLLCFFSIFGAPFIMLFPAFVKNTLHSDSSTLGILMSSVGLGALTAAIYLAARKSVLGLGRLVMCSCFLFGLGLLAMSFVHSVGLAVIVSFPLGFGMIAVAASCNTLLQTIVDDSKRGRIMSIFTMSFFGIPPLGSLIFGYLGDIWGLTNMMFIGGILCIFAAFIFIKYRPIIRKHTRKIYVEKGIVSEIAVGLQSSNENV